MAVSTYVGSFDSRSGTGSQSVTGVGFQPVALIVWGGVGSTSGPGTWWPAVFNSVGVAGATGGITQYAAGIYSEDNNTPNTARSMVAAIISRPNSSGTVANELATLTTFDVDGFTINWTTNTDLAHWNFMAIGGAGVSAKAVTWASGAGTSKSVTGVGFQSDLVFHVGWDSSATPPAYGTLYRFGFGVMNKHGQQWATGIAASDASAPSDTTRWQQTDACLVVPAPSESARIEASFVSIDADGFTLSLPSNSVFQAFSLCLSGVSSKIGAFTSPNSVDGNQIVTSRHNFNVRGAFLSGVSLASTAAPATHAVWSLGATDNTNQRAIGLYDLDAQTPSADANTVWGNNAVVYGAASTTAYASWVSSTFTSFTVNWIGTTGGSALTSREFLYLLIGDGGVSTSPRNLPGTSANAGSTAYSNQRKIYRTSTGVIWTVINYTSAASGEFSYSTDNGATWTYYGAASIAGWTNGSIAGYVDAAGNERLVAVWKQTGTGGGRIDAYTYAMIGTFNGARTTVTWGTAQEAGNGYEDGTTRPYTNYPDVVAHAEGAGTGGQIHVFNSLTNGTVQRVRHYTVPVTGTTFGTWVNTSLTGVGTGNLPSPQASADYDPLTKRLFVAWSNGAAGAGNGIIFKTAAYSAGTWTWASEVVVDTAVYIANTNYWLNCRWDGTRIVIGGLLYTGSQLPLKTWESTNFTTFITRTHITNVGSSDIGGCGSMALDVGTGDIYLFGIGYSADRRAYYKWTRSSNTLSSRVDTEVGIVPDMGGGFYAPSIAHYYSGGISWISTAGNNSPYSIKYDYIQLNNPEVGLTMPSNNSSANLNAGATFKWSYYAADASVQTGWAFRRLRTTDTTAEYWNNATTTWQSFEVYNSGATTSLTFASGKWPVGGSYQWTVSVQNANGVSGYAPAFTVTDSGSATGVQTYVGSFTQLNGVGFQDVTITPNLTSAAAGSWAIIFWTGGSGAASGTWAGQLAPSIGFVASGGGTVTQYSVAACSRDGFAASDTSRRMVSKAITLTFTSGAAFWSNNADFVGFPSATTMRLNWATADTGSAYNNVVINYMIISGLTGAKVVNWSHNAVGNKSVTGVGFQPDLVLHAGQEGGGVGASATLAYFGFGAMNKHGQQWANSIAADDAVNPSNTSRYQQTDAAFALVGPTESPTTQFHFVSMDSDGFTVYFSNAPYFQYPLSLCLKGVSSKLGAFTKNPNASANTQTIPTRQGFTIKGAMFSNTSATPTSAPAAIAYWMLGASDMTNNRSAGISDMDAVSPTVAKSVWYSNKSLMMGISGPGTYVTGVPTTSTTMDTAIAWDAAGGTVESEYLYLLLGDAGTTSVPAAVSTANLADYTAASATVSANQKKMIILSTGRKVVVGQAGNNNAAQFFYSDDGVTWTYYTGAAILGWLDGSIASYVDAGGIERIVVVWKQTGTGGGRTSEYGYAMVGTLNSARTTLTWGTAVAVIPYTNAGWIPHDYYDIVAHAEGAGGVFHFVGSAAQSAPTNYLVRLARSIDGSGVIAGSDLYSSNDGNYGINIHVWPSIDINPTTKDLFVVWSAGTTGAGKGIRFKKATYSSGAWTWGSEVEIDNTVYVYDSNATYGIICRWDSDRALVVVGGLTYTGASRKKMIWDSSNFTSFTARVNSTSPDNITEIYGPGMAVDAGTGDVYLFGSQYTGSVFADVAYYKATRSGATLSLGTRVTTDAGLIGNTYAANTSAIYNTAVNRIEWLYTSGNNSPYAVKYDYLQLNRTPTVTLTSPTDNFSVNLNTTAQNFAWTVSDADGNTQAKYVFRRRKSGASTYEYWNGTAWTIILTEVVSTTNNVTITANTWSGSQSWLWSVGVRDTSAASPIGYSTERTITNSAASTSVGVYVGSFTKATVTGNQDITITPDLTSAAAGSWAIVFWSSGPTAASGTWQTHYFNTLGYTANSGGTISEYSLSVASDDAVVTSNSARRMAAASITITDQNGVSNKDEATFVSFPTATSMRLNWTTQNLARAVNINYMIITGLTGAKALLWTSPAAVGDKAVTGVGFAPDLVMHATTTSGSSTPIPFSDTYAWFSVGAMNKHGQQWANGFSAQDGSSPSNTSRWQQTDAILAGVGISEAENLQAHYKSMDTDGFTVYFSAVASGVTRHVISLCIKGVSSRLGSFVMAGSTGNQTVTTRHGFTPKGLLLTNTFSPSAGSASATASWSLGMTDLTNQRAATLQDQDANSPTKAVSVWHSGSIIVADASSTPTTSSLAAYSSSTTSDFTINWSANNAHGSELLYLTLGDPNTNTVPATIGTTTNAAATSFSNQKKLVRLSTGRMVAAYGDTTSNAKFKWSDDGITWTDYGVDIAGWANGSIVSYVDAGGTERLVVVWNQTGTGGGRTTDVDYIMVGTFSNSLTTLTWGTPASGGNQTTNYHDIVVTPEGSGAVAWYSYASYNFGTVTAAVAVRVNIDPNGVPIIPGTSFTSTDYATTQVTYPSLAIDPLTKRLHMAWSAGTTGAGKGVRYVTAAYANGVWTFASEVEVDNTGFINNANYGIVCRWDGTRVVIGARTGSFGVKQYESTNFTSFSAVTIRATNDELFGYGMAIDPQTGDVYHFGDTGGTAYKYLKWTRSGGIVGSLISLETGVVPDSGGGYWPAMVVSYYNGRIEWVYTHGNNSPYAVKYDYLSVNAAPVVTQVLPEAGARVDLSGAINFSWTFTDAESNTQSAYIFRRRRDGFSAYDYWTGSAWTATYTEVVMATANVTFPSASFTDGRVYYWSVGVKDSAGSIGYSGERKVTNSSGTGVQVRVGSFAKNTGTGNQAITGVGFKPKAIIFWATGAATASGTWDSGVFWSIGFTAGASNSYTVSGSSANNVTTTATQRRMTAGALTFVATSGATYADATLNSFDTDGFTLNWSLAGGGAIVVSYLAIGGDDIAGAKAVQWASSTSTGDKSITGIGFQPDLVFHASSYNYSSLPNTITDMPLGWGAMNKHGQQGTNAFRVANGVAASSTHAGSGQQTDAAIYMVGSDTSTVYFQGHYKSMDSDGFTLNFVNVDGSTSIFFMSLALKGVSSRIGSFVSANAATQAITSIGFTPKGLMISNVRKIPTSAVSTQSIWSLGASDGTNHRAMISSDLNASSPEFAEALWRNDAVLMTGYNGTTVDERASAVFASDQFTLNYGVQTGGFEQLYFALGDSGSNSLPSTVGTSGSTTATSHPNARRLLRLSTGRLVAVYNDGTPNAKFKWSDDGATWTDFSADIAGWLYGSMYATSDDKLFIAWKQSGTGGSRVDTGNYAAIGVLNTAKTGITWTVYGFNTGVNSLGYPSMVANIEGTGWKVHIALSHSSNFAQFYTLGISSSLVFSTDTNNITLGSGYGGTETYPSMDINPTTKDLYVAWSAGAAGAGKGVRFKKATYASGVWTWGAEREIDSTQYNDGAGCWLNCVYDGTRVIIGGELAPSSNIMLYERDITDTATVARTLVAGVSGTTRATGTSLTYDQDGNVYIFGIGGGTGAQPNYRIWKRSTQTLSAQVFLESWFTGQSISAARGYYGTQVDFIYTYGNNAPYAVKYDRVLSANPDDDDRKINRWGIIPI